MGNIGTGRSEMNHLHKAIDVGEYPGKCSHGSEARKSHRRFLRQLAGQGVISLLGASGTPHDLDAIKTGAIHFELWYVTLDDAKVIVDKVADEAGRSEDELRQSPEQSNTNAIETSEARNKRKADFMAAGLWTHPKYKTLKDARADGWHKPREDEIGGEELTLKGHTLVRNTTELRYVYKTTLNKTYGLTPSMIEELGEPDKCCTNPHYQSAPEACLYLIERVEAWVEENQERLKKAQENRPIRSAAMKGVHANQRAVRWQKALEWVEQLSIRVNRPLPTTLLADVRKQFTIPDHVDLLKTKAIHAHVRHRHTNYESLLQELYQQEFSSVLYPLLRQRIDPMVKFAFARWEETTGAVESTFKKGVE
jgi:hypothetical protein